MKAKEYLMQIKNVDKDIDSRIREVEGLRRTLLCAVNLKDVNVQESKSNGVESTYIKLATMTEEIEERINELVDLKMKVAKTIDSLDDNLEKSILRDRYVNNLKWEQIAEHNHFEERHVKRIHGKALCSLDKKIKDVTKCHEMS